MTHSAMQPKVELPQLAAYIEDMIGELADMARAGHLPHLAAMLSLTAIEASRCRIASAAADQAPSHQFRATG